MHNVRIDTENAMKWDNFVDFIIRNIGGEKKADLPAENPFERLVVTIEE